METIKKRIRSSRNNISENSLNVYLSNIRKVFKEVFKNDIDIKHLNQFAKVKKYLETLTPATRKNVMTAIMVLLKASDTKKATLNKYQKYFEGLVADFENNYDNQTKSEKENKNWITQEQLNKKIKELESEISKFDMSKLTKSQEDTIQKHLVLILYTEIPPMRNDYAQMKVYHDKEVEGENYINLKKKVIVLNNYKTSKTYGKKEIDIPSKVVKVVCRWVDITGNEYLLINIRDRNPMTNNGLTKYLNKIFKPKKVSTTLLRKLYLSEKYPVIHNRKDMKKDAYVMGHSLETQQGIYRKK
jgi:hypothetical protein